MPTQIPEEQLLKLTKNYRDRVAFHKNKVRKQLSLYLIGDEPTLAPLFRYEMDYAAHHQKLPPPPDPRFKTTTLVILVGDSFEPLLQSVYAHRPSKIIPVVNKLYPGKERDDTVSATRHWSALRKGIELVQAHYLQDHKIEFPQTIAEGVEDSPEDVFDFLRRELEGDLRNPSCRIVIDITGAKKIMVAGAFMLATYSQTEIYYVDSEKYYDGRPLGYGCNFKKIENPLVLTAIDIWEKIGQLYERSDFAGAGQLFAQLPKAHQAGAAGKRLKKFLEICDDWDRGLWREAREKAYVEQHNKWEVWFEPLAEAIPPAIKVAGRYWPDLSGDKQQLTGDFFADLQAMIAYANDELARARRFHNIEESKARQDNRAVFTRLFSVHETLLKARAVLMYKNGHLTTTSKKLERNIVKSLIQMSRKKAMDIATGADEYIDIEGVNFRIDLPHGLSFEPNRQIVKTRNLTVHNYFPVSSDMTRKAIALVVDDLENFVDKWLPRYCPPNQRGEIEEWKTAVPNLPSWEKLILQCDLRDVIPSKNVDEKENP